MLILREKLCLETDFGPGPLIVGPLRSAHSLVRLRAPPALQPEAAKQVVPAQVKEGAQGEQRQDQEEEDQQSIPEGRVFI